MALTQEQIDSYKNELSGLKEAPAKGGFLKNTFSSFLERGKVGLDGMREEEVDESPTGLNFTRLTETPQAPSLNPQSNLEGFSFGDPAEVTASEINQGFQSGGLTIPQRDPGFIEDLSRKADVRVERVGEILARKDTPFLEKYVVQTGGQGLGLLTDLAAKTFEKAVEVVPGADKALEGYGKAINVMATDDRSPLKWLGEKLGSTDFAVEAVNLYDTDPNFRDTLDGFTNINIAALDLAGALQIANSTEKIAKKVWEKSVGLAPDAPARQVIEKSVQPYVNQHIQTRADGIKSMLAQADPSDIAKFTPDMQQAALGIKSDLVLGLNKMGYSDYAKLIANIPDNLINNIDDLTRLSNEALNLQVEGFLPGLGRTATEALEGGRRVVATAADDIAAGVRTTGEDILRGAADAVDPITGFPRRAGEAVAERTRGITETGSQAVRDIIPTKQAVINENVTKALDFAPGDLDKIVKSTDNQAGIWLADKNLIGVNKAETVRNIENLADAAYAEVRTAIGNVDIKYSPKQIRAYREALTEIQKRVGTRTGLGSLRRELKTLLNKREISLSDVQRAKELMDEHFNLYNVVGDVGAGLDKSGLANTRQKLRKFIEKEVTKFDGTDIRALNNDVATGRTILETVKTRSQKGLTRSNLKIGDLGAFGIGSTFGGPVGGLAFLAFKKLSESAPVRLRFAKWLDSVDDAEKARALRELEKGNVPDPIREITGV